MVWLRSFFASHQQVWTLLHGQVFFVLGISILFLTRGGVRLALARELGSLAALGFCEAVAAWTRAWLRLSASPPAWLSWMRLVVLALGYAFLLAFALQVILGWRRGGPGRWVVPAGILVLWAVALVVIRFSGSGVSRARLQLLGEISARYGLAFPGGLLGAWGLRRETYRTIEPDRLPLVKPPMRVTELALGAFALVAGAIVPAAPFFPANWLNEDLLLSQMGLAVSLLRGLAGIGITVGVVRALGIVLKEIDLWLESVEQMQALGDERERIGRELHDGIIQSLYASGLVLEGARQQVVNNPEEAAEQMTVAIENLNQAIQDIRNYIFDLRGEMPQDDLETSLRDMLDVFRANTLLETDLLVGGEQTTRLDAERRQHVLQIAREALTNVARHARAQQVVVHLEYGPEALELSLADDGVGLSSIPGENGQGLRNIRERTRLLNGRLDIHTAPGAGLQLLLTVPYAQRIRSNVGV